MLTGKKQYEPLRVSHSEMSYVLLNDELRDVELEAKFVLVSEFFKDKINVPALIRVEEADAVVLDMLEDADRLADRERADSCTDERMTEHYPPSCTTTEIVPMSVQEENAELFIIECRFPAPK